MNKLIAILFCTLLLCACKKDEESTQHISFLFRIENVDAGPDFANIRAGIYGPGRIKVDKVLAHLDYDSNVGFDTVIVVAENFETVGSIVFTVSNINFTTGTSCLVRLEAQAHGHPIESNDYSFFIP